MDHLWTPWRYEYLAGTAGSSRKGVPEELAAWPGDLGCVFCNLLAAAAYAVEHGKTAEQAERAAGILLYAKHTFLCLNKFPYTSGHLMILPYAHQGSLAALEAETAQEMMALAQRTAAVLDQVYSPGGLNLGMNLGHAAGAGVAGHLHLHMLPRWTGDVNFMTTIAETRVLPETLDITWERLHTAFLGKAHLRTEEETSPEDKSVSRNAKNPVGTHIKQDPAKQPNQTGANSAQPVEAEDKSSGTQNPVDQKHGLEPNVHGDQPQSKPVPDQPAAQHATGSFTGKGEKSGE